MTKRLINPHGATGRRGAGPSVAHRISGAGELLQAVPYLLGFHPARSLVLVGLRDGMLVVTARLDLVDAEAGASADAGSLVGALASMCDGGTTEVLAAIYPDDAAGKASHEGHGTKRWDELLARLSRAVETLPCQLSDVLLVADERWRSVGCRVPGCCPTTGRPLPEAPSSFATHATVDGVVPLPDRGALAAVLDPLPAAERRDVELRLAALRDEWAEAAHPALTARRERSLKRALFAAARASTRARWEPPGDDDGARFVLALADPAIRDAVWLAIDARKLDGRPLWRDLARRAPKPSDAPPLFLHGWASWRAGDGAMANIAAQRAISSDQDYAAADLLLAALSHGVDPRRFPRLRRTA